MSHNHNQGHHQNHDVAKSKYLPDWDKAERYRKASRIGSYDQADKDICQFSRQPVNKKQFPICQDTKTLQFLGFGFPLFYMFLRYCILLLFILLVTQSFISTYISVSEGVKYCAQHHQTEHEQTEHPKQNQKNEQHGSILHLNYLKTSANLHLNQGANKQQLAFSQKCSSFFVLLARTQKRQTQFQIVFRIASFLATLVFLLYMKDQILKKLDYYDERQSDLSDFTVMIKSIPKHQNGIKRKFNQFMNQHFYRQKSDKNDTAYVHEIILISDVHEIQHANHFFQQKLEHYLQHPNAQNLHHLEDANSTKAQIARQTMRQIRNDTIQSKEAIIIFETQTKKFEFLDYVNQEDKLRTLSNYFAASQPIVVQQAPQPREINYQNLQYQHNRKRYVLIGWGLSLLFLAIITVVFYFIQLVKSSKIDQAIQQLEQDPHSQQAKSNQIIAGVIAWVCLVGIVLFNKFIMGKVLHYFTELQKHDNKAYQYLSFAFKYAVGMFFTTAIMTILVQAFKFNNYYSHQWGVIQQETIMFILCAFIIPLIWIINPWQLCHVMQRNKHFKSMHIPQHQANHLVADYHYDMGKRFAQVMQMMWFTFLYVDLIPIGTLLIMIGLMIYYWIDKYNLLRRASVDGNMSGQIVVGALKLLDAVLFWRFAGELIFDIQIRQGARIQTFVFLGISIVYLLLPWEDILEYVNHEEFKLNQKTFTLQKHRFQHDNYKHHHPIYKQMFQDGQQHGQTDFLATDLLDFANSLNKNKQPNQPSFLQQQKLLRQDIRNGLFPPANQ